MLESKSVQPNFSFYFSFLITSQLLKKRRENDRRIVSIHLAKKNLERRTKKKQNAQVLRTFKCENNDDRDLEEAHNFQLDVSRVRAKLAALSLETSS